MTFNDLDEKQKKHYIAAIYHQMAARKKQRDFDFDGAEDHRMMANLHANHGGLGLEKLDYAIAYPSSQKDSNQYVPPEIARQEGDFFNSKNHENDSMLPFDANKMIDGLKHHIIQKIFSQQIGDSDARKYHQKMANWHDSMLGGVDISKRWTPEEIESIQQKAGDLDSDGRQYYKDPVNYGTEVFPSYVHPEVKEILDQGVPAESWSRSQIQARVDKKHLFRPEDIEKLHIQSPDKDLLSEHPFLPESSKIDSRLRALDPDNIYRRYRNPHDHPSITRSVIERFKSDRTLSDKEKNEKIAEIISRSNLDRSLHEFALNHKSPKIRAAGIKRTKDEDRAADLVESEKEKFLSGEHNAYQSAIPHLMSEIPHKDLPDVLSKLQDQYGTEDLKGAIQQIGFNHWDKKHNSEEAAPFVRWLMGYNPTLGLELLRPGNGLKHVRVGDLPENYYSMGKFLKDKETHPSVVAEILRKFPSWDEALSHPNAPRDVLDSIRNQAPTHLKRSLKLALNLMRRPDHTREDIDFARKVRDKVVASNNADRNRRSEMLNLIQNSPAFTADDLRKEYADRESSRENWMLEHPNTPADLIYEHHEGLREGDKDTSVLDYKNTGPGLFRDVFEDAIKNFDTYGRVQLGNYLSDPRLPIQTAQAAYESESDSRTKEKFARELLKHPDITPETVKQILEKHPHLKETKPQLLSPSVLEHVKIAPPASVPNVRKDRLIYEVKHKPSSLAIESLAKEFAESPTLTWNKVKKKFPHLEKNEQIKSIFAGAPEITKDDFMQRVSALPDKKFPISYRKWTGMQRHNDAPQLVVQLNAGSDFRKQLANKKGLLSAFDTWKDKLFSRHHPILPHSLAWARVDTSHPEHWFVDEIQSDLDADLKQHWDPEISKLGSQHGEKISENLKGWNEHLLQHVINIARSHGVKRLSIHSKKSKMKANHGEDRASSKYKEIYDTATKRAGFHRVSAKDVGLHERSAELAPDSEVHTLDLTNHSPVASNGPQDLGKPIKRKRKSDSPQIISPKKIDRPELAKLTVGEE